MTVPEAAEKLADLTISHLSALTSAQRRYRLSAFHASVYRHQKQAAHTTMGGKGKVGRLKRKP